MHHLKVVIIGGGFGGINAAKALNKAKVELLVIDKSNHHLFQPMLYQVATAAISTDNIAVPIREILAHQKNTVVMMADITKIDKEKKEIIAGNGEHFKFDILIVATGARHSYFGHPEWEAVATGLKTVDDAIKIRERILLSYERAERSDSYRDAKQFLRFMIIGAGPTGVELAGAIAEVAHTTLINDFRHVKPQHTKIFLIEGADEVLPTFPKDLGAIARRDLKKLGVEVMLNSIVTEVTQDGVWIKDKFMECRNIFWAAGNQASKLLKTLELPMDAQGRLKVMPDLSVTGYPDIFVIGDAAYAETSDGKTLPGVAPVAIQQGKYVANIIKNQIPPDKRIPFVYNDKGSIATIGKGSAVYAKGKFKTSGYVAWLGWCFIHVFYMISFSNKILVMFQWMNTFFTNKRPNRIIARDISDTEDTLHKD